LAKIFCVDPKVVDRVWKLARPILEPAFSDNSDSTIEATEADVLSGISFLWVAWDGNKILAAATTVLVKTPRYKMCIVTSAGGVGSKLWNEFMPLVEQYARDEGCERVRAMGRQGWAKVLSGYEQPWIVLDKVLV
jgi:hypothetical protein